MAKYADLTTKKARIAHIKAAMEASDSWLLRGLMAIYKGQTDEEKATGATLDDNGIGFNGVDAEILTSFAVQYQERGFLTPKQIAFARKKMIKYAGQLVKLTSK